MAARLTKRQNDKCKDAIQGTLLIKKLNDHALGNNIMESTQIQAAKILLDKIVSNAPTELKSNVDIKGDVITKVEYLVVYPTDVDPTK